MNAISSWPRLVAVSLLALLALGSLSAHAATGKVAGKVQFEKIPFRDAKGNPGLVLAKPVLRPVALAKVQLIDVAGKVIAKATTDAAGNYILSWSATPPPAATVQVLADADNAVVVDHFNPKSVFSVRSPTFTLKGGNQTQNITAQDATRESGPFNILAAIQIGNKLVRAAEKGIALPRITVHWTTKNRPGTSFFNVAKNEAFIVGNRLRDSDEFDDFVILHEYGHFLSETFSRDDSPGGSHGKGDSLDPRLAWGEGWGNFFACAALNDPKYVDTGANATGVQLAIVQFNLDEDIPSGEVKGFVGEHSVGGLLWDLFDKKPGTNHLSVGFGEIWKTLRSKAWKDLPPYRHMIDFCDVLVVRRPDLKKGVTALLKARGVTYTPGATPPVPNPYIRELKTGVALTGDVSSKFGTNKFSSRAVFSFTLSAKKNVKLHLDIVSSKDPKNADLDLFLIDSSGKSIKFSIAANGVGGTEDIAAELPPGRFFVEVRAFAKVSGTDTKNLGAFSLRADF